MINPTPKRLLSKDEVSDWIDRAAMHTMQGLLASDIENQLPLELAAKLAYRGARALWAERNSTATSDANPR